MAAHPDRRRRRQPTAGVVFPLDEGGRRSTMPVNRAICAAAARVADSELAERIDASERWRSEYLGQVRAVTELGARSGDTAIKVAEAGLEAARGRMVFRRDGTDHRLAEAAALPPAVRFATETIQGSGCPEGELVVPYRGERLRSGALRRRIDASIEGGIIEPSAGAALEAVIDNPEWLRLDGRCVAVLGAGAETSPLAVLSAWGADALAVDLPRPAVWKRVLDAARSGAGRVRIPVREGRGNVEQRAGANLISDVPETAAWLREFAEADPLVLGSYIYADGALHVQATMAADAVAEHLLAAGHDVAMTYAGTPSDCYLVPPEVVADSAVRRGHVGMEVFEPRTMRTVMAALMVHDLHNPPDHPHPERRVAHAAVHGGYWRRPYDIRSTLTFTAILGLPKAYAPLLRAR